MTDIDDAIKALEDFSAVASRTGLTAEVASQRLEEAGFSKIFPFVLLGLIARRDPKLLKDIGGGWLKVIMQRTNP